MKRAELRRRIDAMAAIVKPANSIAARVDTLTDGQRAAYWNWRAINDDWHQQHPGADAYQQSLKGHDGPQLRNDVAAALGLIVPTIPADATDAQAVEIYRNYIAGDAL